MRVLASFRNRKSPRGGEKGQVRSSNVQDVSTKIELSGDRSDASIPSQALTTNVHLYVHQIWVSLLRKE